MLYFLVSVIVLNRRQGLLVVGDGLEHGWGDNGLDGCEVGFITLSSGCYCAAFE